MKITIIFLSLFAFFGCKSVSCKNSDNSEKKRQIFFYNLMECYGADYGDSHLEKFKLVFTPLSDAELKLFYEKSYNLRIAPELGYDHEFVAGYKFSSLGFRHRGLLEDCFSKYLVKNVEMFKRGYLLAELPLIPLSLFSEGKKGSTVDGELVKPRYFKF